MILISGNQHNNWHFPNNIKTRPLRELDDDDFLHNHKASAVASRLREDARGCPVLRGLQGCEAISPRTPPGSLELVDSWTCG